MIHVTPENFQQLMFEDSKQKLVLVVFWADQIPESVQMRDALAARLAGKEQAITFAGVDCQQQQQIAAQFGIQSLPTAVVVKDGQPIDGIAGPQTDESLSQFVDKHLPRPEDELLQLGQAALAQNQPGDAMNALQQAHGFDAERADIALALADCYIQLGKLDDAETLLATIKMVDQDSYFQSLVSKLELAREASQSPEIQALEQKLQADPDNIDIQRQLAAQYSQNNRQEEALDMLFKLLQKDMDDSESRKILLDILAALPAGDALAGKYRRKLYTLMY
ncbi:tetratricopeptide repeat protein [Thalassotalea mangrovi]|uniref:Tetratricopeptide repeat protein n=1 Tax=Thalassotalea mangrovi TaxID=2572245 RepID=A0A4U1BA42_9GAMM|nr:tetratricopeptide repeat protein [Thalassotalea mangrovi]TKB47383.1 tetratricopeptide repeat protein [Thalassotalea mangrovi]